MVFLFIGQFLEEILQPLIFNLIATLGVKINPGRVCSVCEVNSCFGFT